MRTKITTAITLLALCCLAADAPAPAANLLKPTADPASWRLEQHEGAKGTIAAAEGAIVLDVTNDTGTEWHVQVFQTGLDLKDGKEYVFTFKARADADRPIKANAGIDEDDWHFIGLDEELNLGKEWKEYSLKFTVSDPRAGKNRIGFILGMAKGKIYVKDAVLKPAA